MVNHLPKGQCGGNPPTTSIAGAAGLDAFGPCRFFTGINFFKGLAPQLNQDGGPYVQAIELTVWRNCYGSR